MAYFFGRRKTNLLVAASVFTLFFYCLVRFWPISAPEVTNINAPDSTRSETCARYSQALPFTPSNTTWRDLPAKHPPGPVEQLPPSTPRRLRRVQHHFPDDYKPSARQHGRRKSVKDVFIRCWTSYKERAWLKDELRPVTGGHNDRYGGWAATLVDNLDTLWIIELREDFHKAVEAALTIDFGDPTRYTRPTISVFETTVRHLGGLISAYELTDCADLRILDKATQLGDMLLVSFDTQNRMPMNRWNPRKALIDGEEQQPAPDDNTLAGVASLTLEFTRLSQLTGDMRYFSAVQRVTDALAEQQSLTKLLGMWPQRYDSGFNFMKGDHFSLGGESDSAYEYLIKMVLALGNDDHARQYEDMYVYAMDIALQYVIFRPMTSDGSDVLLTGKVTPEFIPESEHLACFAGGMFALSGQVLANNTHLDVGRKLTEGCAWIYRSMPSGIAPENWQTVKCGSKDHCEWNATLWHDGPTPLPEGITRINDARYHLRPEALESMFYLYRITGDVKYQDMAWALFESINNQTQTEYCNAKLPSVFENPAAHNDEMESFWMAETLKYMYLLFSNPDYFSLDDYVFSTEAHPFRIPKPG